MKKDMPLEGLRWSRDSGSALYDTPQNGRSRTGWGGVKALVAILITAIILVFILTFGFSLIGVAIFLIPLLKGKLK